MKFLDKYLKIISLPLILSITGSFLSAIFKLSSSLIVSYVLDHVINDLEITNPLYSVIDVLVFTSSYLKENYHLVFFVVITITLLYAMSLSLRIKMQTKASEILANEIRNDLYDHIQRLSYDYHNKSQTGDLIQRCTSDVDLIRRFFSGQLQEIVNAVSLVIIGLTVLFNINVTLTFICVSLMPILFIFAYKFMSNVQTTYQSIDESEAQLTSYVQEVLSGIRVVKAFNTETRELEKFEKYNKTYADGLVKLVYTLGSYWSISDVICLVQIGIVVIFGIVFTNEGFISPGNLFVFYSYISMIIWPIRQIGRLLAETSKMKVSTSRLKEIIDTPIEDYHSGIDVALKGDIVLKNVSFSYDKNIVLDNINLTINKGETIAIIGPTASGKSTLINLLNGLYKLKHGDILYDGISIKDINLKSLRKNINVVLQEPFLFSKSIDSNIKIAKENSSNYDIEKAAKYACVHNDILDFELGYQTLVGEKGVTLSGGQKQRIAIARTIINKSPIIIFDDSLSAVDSETDKSIREAIKKYNNSTNIIITQRINSAMTADKVVVLENGKITAVSTHQELIKVDGLYKRIYEVQSQMIKEDDDANKF